MKVFRIVWLVVLFVVVATSGCNESDSGRRAYGTGHDFGGNDPDLYVCIGDSITAGFGGVTPYPQHLATMLGKRVVNQGIGGERVWGGAGRTAATLDQYKPGFLLILEGVNDIQDNAAAEDIIPYLRSMIEMAKARKVLPAIATITPFFGVREPLNERVFELNAAIRRLASEQGILLVDCERVVRRRPDYVLEDGLHLSEAGSVAVAAAWADRL
ncbi:MAG: SGNH/GDSL hydrolase family protein [Kiritimatiellia bacterium]